MFSEKQRQMADQVRHTEDWHQQIVELLFFYKTQNTMGDTSATLPGDASSEGNFTPVSMVEDGADGARASPHHPPDSLVSSGSSGLSGSQVDALQSQAQDDKMHHAKESVGTQGSPVDCQHAQSLQEAVTSTADQAEEPMNPALSGKVGELQVLTTSPRSVVAEGAEPEGTCTETSRKEESEASPEAVLENQEDFQVTLQPEQQPTGEPESQCFEFQQLDSNLSMERGQSVMDNVHSQTKDTVAEQRRVSVTPEVMPREITVTPQQQGCDIAEETLTLTSDVPTTLTTVQHPDDAPESALNKGAEGGQMCPKTLTKEEQQLQAPTTTTVSTSKLHAPSIGRQKESLTSLSLQEQQQFRKELKTDQSLRDALKMTGEDIRTTSKTKRFPRKRPWSLSYMDTINDLEAQPPELCKLVRFVIDRGHGDFSTWLKCFSSQMNHSSKPLWTFWGTSSGRPPDRLPGTPHDHLTTCQPGWTDTQGQNLLSCFALLICEILVNLWYCMLCVCLTFSFTGHRTTPQPVWLCFQLRPGQVDFGGRVTCLLVCFLFYRMKSQPVWSQLAVSSKPSEIWGACNDWALQSFGDFS
ncbi:uncharacterized protein LOC121930023 [Sceloporus undulatus]|uniref:uncharacterized protein LOC121930023 n=1 Tax=Sceloporus undulatus TaxID=8520 RepID=UPI001C4AC694|nr:uncharacterized protein LOC121930023 [Sceloporus undulatus]